jgi:hypothetical protein
VSTQAQTPEICQYCPHPFHIGRCLQCKCKGKPGWFSRMLGGLGNAIGESLFGGSR